MVNKWLAAGGIANYIAGVGIMEWLWLRHGVELLGLWTVFLHIVAGTVLIVLSYQHGEKRGPRK